MSNLREIKDMALNFLELEIKETEISPIAIMHPFFESGFVIIDGVICNILEDNLALEKRKSFLREQINSSIEAKQIFILIRKSYRLTFYKYVYKFLSKEEKAVLLIEAYCNSEFPNADVNVTTSNLLKYFKMADKSFLMSKEEKEIYDNLPNEVIVYRGVSKQHLNPNALSWTLSKEQAEWFSTRFHSSGYVLKAKIKKENIFCFKSLEEETILNYKNIYDLEKYQTQK